MEQIDPRLVPKRTLNNGEQIPCIGMGTVRLRPTFTPEEVSACRGRGHPLQATACLTAPPSTATRIRLVSCWRTPCARAWSSREDLFIVSKVWNDMHGKGDVLLSLRAERSRTCASITWTPISCTGRLPNYHAPGCDGDSRNPDSKPIPTWRNFMATWRQMERLA